ncbi:glycosyltransferase family 4 protein [Acinetobacter baumannii]|nr:glycosyltransferase family 4 protein [Acinetobacter baumannii]
MKVAYLVPSITNCGPINVVLNIINSNLPDVDFYVFSLKKLNNDYEEKFSKILNGNLFFLDNSVSFVENLKILLLTNSIDIIHSHGYYPDKILSKLEANVKKISTIHCMFYKDYPKEYGILKGFIGAFFHFFYLKNGNFDYIISCSNSVNDYVSSKVKKGNFFCINNGVDQRVFYPLSFYERENRKNNLKLSQYQKVFIYSGRLIRRKRVPELIEYFQENYDDSCVLLIIGDGPELQECKRKKRSKNIVFIGFVSNPEYYYQISDFILSFSSAEGYPMSIIEAVSCGCYAILSPIPPHIEFIKNTNLGMLIGSNENFKFNNNRDKLSSKNMALNYLSLYEKE